MGTERRDLYLIPAPHRPPPDPQQECGGDACLRGRNVVQGTGGVPLPPPPGPARQEEDLVPALPPRASRLRRPHGPRRAHWPAGSRSAPRIYAPGGGVPTSDDGSPEPLPVAA